MNPYQGSASGKFQPTMTAMAHRAGQGAPVRAGGAGYFGPLKAGGTGSFPLRQYNIPKVTATPGGNMINGPILANPGGGFNGPGGGGPVHALNQHALAAGILQALQQGLNPQQIQRMLAGNVPGQEGGIFQNMPGLNHQDMMQLGGMLNKNGRLGRGRNAAQQVWQLLGSPGFMPGGGIGGGGPIRGDGGGGRPGIGGGGGQLNDIHPIINGGGGGGQLNSGLPIINNGGNQQLQPLPAGLGQYMHPFGNGFGPGMMGMIEKALYGEGHHEQARDLAQRRMSGVGRSPFAERPHSMRQALIQRAMQR